MDIRYATIEDIKAITAVETECFPPAEAATEKEFIERVRYYGNHFWLMFEQEKLIAFVDGFVTDEPDLTDEMYENASMHNENGAWQMIFGVNTLPTYRKYGYAECVKVTFDEKVTTVSKLMGHLFEIIDPYSQNKQGVDVGKKYRTGIYSTSARHLDEAKAFIEKREDRNKIVVEVLPLTNYVRSAEEHQHHLERYPEDCSFCHIPDKVLNKYRDN